jgi:hypothetical protein
MQIVVGGFLRLAFQQIWEGSSDLVGDYTVRIGRVARVS